MTDPDDPYDRPPGPMLGLGFWIALVFGAVCIALALAVWAWGPSFFPRR